jgi:hypothetical protein
MSKEELATEETKNSIENSVNWYLADKLVDPSTVIATKKFITNDNLLIYLTHCNVAEISVPRIKLQVLKRVDGGVQETVYQIFSDHRFMTLENNMIFGSKSGKVPDETSRDVTEKEAQELITLINSLTQARQTL